VLEDVIPTAQYVIKHPTSKDCLSDSGGNSEERNTRLLSNSMKWQTSRPWDAFYGHCIDFKPAHKKKKKKKRIGFFELAAKLKIAIHLIPWKEPVLSSRESNGLIFYHKQR